MLCLFDMVCSCYEIISEYSNYKALNLKKHLCWTDLKQCWSFLDKPISLVHNIYVLIEWLLRYLTCSRFSNRIGSNYNYSSIHTWKLGFIFFNLKKPFSRQLDFFKSVNSLFIKAWCFCLFDKPLEKLVFSLPYHFVSNQYSYGWVILFQPVYLKLLKKFLCNCKIWYSTNWFTF